MNVFGHIVMGLTMFFEVLDQSGDQEWRIQNYSASLRTEDVGAPLNQNREVVSG